MLGVRELKLRRLHSYINCTIATLILYIQTNIRTSPGGSSESWRGRVSSDVVALYRLQHGCSGISGIFLSTP
jgi:hypothetical protein